MGSGIDGVGVGSEDKMMSRSGVIESDWLNSVGAQRSEVDEAGLLDVGEIG